MDIATIFLESAIKRVSLYRDLAETAMIQLKEEDFHFRPDPGSNSIAIIIQHMSGNMISRWTNFLSEDGEKPWRSRDLEFNDQHFSREHLLKIWQQGWDCFLKSLHSLEPHDLLKTIQIRTEPILVIDAINRQLSHYPNHAGQIIYIAKMIKGKDWQSLSIPPGESANFNRASGLRYN
ncbi:DUF1572 family protein [Flavitalea sp.]|nr:DUF1572 family protein [Flavitalea sp.]